MRKILIVDDEELMQEFAKPFFERHGYNVFYADRGKKGLEIFKQENPDTDVPYIGRYIQLYIAEGCPWDCTYCSERLAFPQFRSFPEEEIIKAAHYEMERSGKNKVVLLADSVGDYGKDTGSSLPNLIRRLRGELPGIVIALQDLNPYHFLIFRDQMVGFINEGFIAHLQIPYQSANDRILELMARPYTKADLKEVFEILTAIGFTEIDSHILVGFPSETDEEFEESVQFAIDNYIKYMLVNSFMESPGIPATNFPSKVSYKTKLRRLRHAEQRFKAAGILYNCDNSSFACERFKKMNKLSGVDSAYNRQENHDYYPRKEKNGDGNQ